VHFVLPQCIDDSKYDVCNTEGYDNSVLAWTTNFFVGTIFALIGLCVSCRCNCCSCCKSERTTTRTVTSGLAFGFLSLTFLIRGVIGRYFPNSGADDGHGQVGYYLLTFVSYTFWTISSVFLLTLVCVAWDTTLFQEYHFGRHAYKIFFGMMVFCFVLMSLACVWNSVALWNAADFSVDDHNQGAAANSLPIWLLSATTVAWNILFCAFLIASVYVWTMLARQKDHNVMVGNLSYSVAAFSIVFLQLVNAVVVLLLTLYNVGIQKKMLYDKTANSVASVVFNFCTLLTGWIIYNFILALFPSVSRNTEKNNKDDHLDRAVVVEVGDSYENDGEGKELEHINCKLVEKHYETTADRSSDGWTIMTKRVLDTLTDLFSFARQGRVSEMAEATDEITISDGTLNELSQTPLEILNPLDETISVEC
jgi:hypothetical protein